jgi:hypothetical protein
MAFVTNSSVIVVMVLCWNLTRGRCDATFKAFLSRQSSPAADTNWKSGLQSP